MWSLVSVKFLEDPLLKWLITWLAGKSVPAINWLSPRDKDQESQFPTTGTFPWLLGLPYGLAPGFQHWASPDNWAKAFHLL